MTGRITGIDDGILNLETSFAGSLAIKLDAVIGFSTEEEAFLRLADGSEPKGRVQDRVGQPLLVAGDVPIETPKTAVRQLWRAVDENPSIVAERAAAEALRKKWSSSISFDLTGSSGNSDNFGLASKFKGAYGNERAETKYYFSYHKSDKSGETTADETKAGAEYSSLFGKKLGWYVKSDLESDRLEEVDLRSTTAAGINYAFLDQEDQELTVRSGLAFRYEAYANRGNLDGPAVDLGFDHSYRLAPRLSIVSEVDYVPSIEDFVDYRITQDTGMEMPLVKGGRWKLRVGLSNDYNSLPALGREHLDMRYYSRLIFSWE